MLTDYASVGGIEVWNTGRLQGYLRNVGSPFTTGPDVCNCDSLTPEILGLGFPAYQTPALDPAPWYDPDYPVSAEYLGFLPLSVAGVSDNPRGRSVSNAVGGGGVFGPVRNLPRTITVTGVIIGTSCCGAEYGLHFLSEVLSGCTGEACDGDCFEMYACCPDGETLTPVQFNAKYKRTFRRTALVSGPTVVQRQGDGTCASGNCAGGGDLITVEFVLVAANPWAWTDPVPLLDVPLPTPPGEIECVDWCMRDPVTGTGDCEASECLFGDCADVTDCTDPTQAVPSPPQPTTPLTSFCVPLGTERACYEIDLSDRPEWSSDVPIITLESGSDILRNVRILIFAKPAGSLLNCGEIADTNRCDPVAEFVITFVPAGSVLTLDGQVGRALLVCNDECIQSTHVYGDQNGGPLRFPELGCATYCLCIETDPEFPPAGDAELSFSISGRGL